MKRAERGASKKLDSPRTEIVVFRLETEETSRLNFKRREMPNVHLEKLAKEFWTPDLVETFIKRGLHQPHRCFIIFVTIWTAIGLIVSAAFFSGSLTAMIPFCLLGIVTGLMLPPFLMLKTQERSPAKLRGEDQKK